jgi:cbb3-type cytochrome oxidase subunit 3
MTIANFHSMLTLLGIVAFVAMIIWVFSKGQRASMDQHARIPLDDDAPPAGPESQQSNVQSR